MFSLQVRIPLERVGVLIGHNESVKRKVEEMTGVKLEIDSTTGSVNIKPAEGMKDPSMLLKAMDVVKAIGQGFSPERAFRLFNEGIFLETIDLSRFVGKSKEDLKRIKGRLIGRKGKARKLIEELTGAYISIYEKTVSIIGDIEALSLARKATQMLLEGKKHSTVHRFLSQRRRLLKEAKLDLWV